jgi:hypothetical protein
VIFEISRGLLSAPVKEPTRTPEFSAKCSQASIVCPPRSTATCQSPEILAAVTAGSETGTSTGRAGAGASAGVELEHADRTRMPAVSRLVPGRRARDPFFERADIILHD